MASASVGGRPVVNRDRAFLILAAMTGLTPLATDMYIPAFPAMANELAASGSAIQSSIAAYMLGLVVGQLLLGPISDHTGRRPLLVAGAWLFALFSAVCVVAPGADLLILARLLQGMAGAAAMVLARAIIGDWYNGAEAARRFSALTMIFAVGPILAPVLGGLLLGVGSWRLIFVVLAVLGVLLALPSMVWIPESLPPARRHTDSLVQAFRTMGALLKRRVFVGYVLVFAFATVSLFAYLAGVSFVLQSVFGLSEWVTSLLFGLNAIGMLLGGAVFGALSRQYHVHRFLVAGVVLGLVATSILWGFSVSLLPTLAALFVAMLATGLVFPAVLAAGQAAAPHASGGASALLGAGQCLFGALAAPLVGVFGVESVRPMAGIMIAGFVLGGTALIVLIQPWRQHDPIQTNQG
ncbi:MULTISPECIES: Bcr/CflA family efflux MFS transporter [unclassified Brenneria]|uniref:Bcr/CflA family efflux MFS transporter n=1 Tax=unclassified Brenneria TaxID=2634434 RepID=UPI0029C59B86|nr:MULTISPECIES: Bcr/CflA family efflux MFS transporter [unclassified Brenneria]MDX5630844.1 Bcr/CflA family efflux MFS transporter [Brenneria sp. L3-3Z]MDX5697926.1 Bcr/CflA family efflux MFS transporter [Brenneria sp. L4-2C]